MIKVLKRNVVKCLGCNTVLESAHQHDFVACLCPNQTFTDGGKVYQRVGGKDLSLIENLSEYVEYTDEEYEAYKQEQSRKAQEILDERIANGEMVLFGGSWVSKNTYNLIINEVLKGI